MTTFATDAPVFSDLDYGAPCIGLARTEGGALDCYRAYYAGSDIKVVGVKKITMEPGGRDGWAPVFA